MLGVRVRALRHQLVPDVGDRVDLSPMFEQDLDDRGVSLCYREHERRLAACGGSVHVGAPLQQHPNHIRTTRPRGGDEGHLAEQQRRVGVGARRKQLLGHGAAAVPAGRPDRCRTEVVGEVDVGPGSNQEIDAGRIVLVASPRAARSNRPRSGRSHPRRRRSARAPPRYRRVWPPLGAVARAPARRLRPARHQARSRPVRGGRSDTARRSLASAEPD